ncbi:MAG: hypothetical protein ACFE7E_01925 [Candidatus Hodarchaeota archaeon]
MPHWVETTDVLKWKYPGRPRKIKALIRKKFDYVRKKQIQYKHKKGKLKAGKRSDYAKKEHRYHKYRKRKLK